MTIRFAGAALLTLACALVPTAGASASAAEATDSPGPFIQCDGRTGHVSTGESVLRLLLVTATAGLSEAAMAGDDDSHRAKGAAGVAACDAALQSEGDRYRRVQLGLARALHFGESGQWHEAAEAARQTPDLIARGDWALDRSAATAAANIEAWALVQQGKLAEAEAVQARAVLRAGTDALALQRIPMYLRLTSTMSDAKRSAYWHLLRYAPQHSATVIHGFADARAYSDARRAAAAAVAVEKAMFTRGPSSAEGPSLDAMFAAMAGEPAAAAASLATARAEFAKERAAGRARSDAIAGIEEQIAFAEAALAYAEGRHDDALRLTSQRTLWGNIAPGMVADLLGRLATVTTNPSATSPLQNPGKLWDEAVAARASLIKEDPIRKQHWGSLVQLMVDDHYRPLSKQAMTGSTRKPKWLIKPDKEEPLKFDLISVEGRFTGPATNEPMMLHAALVAQARGKKGFVLLPARKYLSVIGFRPANPGDEGIADESIIAAAPLIAELAPRVSAPRQAASGKQAAGAN